MKVLDLFCGKGGWSVPFIEDGAHVVGVDIVDLGYPGHLILEDIRNLDGHRFRDYDLIIGSPPCDDLSKVAVKGRRHPPDLKKALSLVQEFNRVVNEAKPRFWAFENVSRLEKFYPVKPILRFRMGAQARRTLWGNIPIALVPDFRFPNRILASRTGRYYAKRKGVKALVGRDFAMIPYPIARFIADCVKHQIEVQA